MMSIRNLSTRFLLWGILACLMSPSSLLATGLRVSGLRCEYRKNPLGIDETRPRLTWLVESDERGQRQTAYRILVAGDPQLLVAGEADLWDSGRVPSDQTVNVVYAGKPLQSRQACFWRVQVWDKDGKPSVWSPVAHWSMGLLAREDWSAKWISHRDTAPLHTSRKVLFLPSARHYRKDFDPSEYPPSAAPEISRATLYVAALGLVDMYLNGERVSDAYFETGWADYRQRAYYRAHDVTDLVSYGPNRIGAVLADGWYAGYVGYGFLVGLGPNKAGRYMYGKTPAFIAQLELEFEDGSRRVIATDDTWEVSADGPIREADLIMGEAFDARLDVPDWSAPLIDSDWEWEKAIRAEDNGPVWTVFHDNRGARKVNIGFREPAKLQAYPAPPIRITEELSAVELTEPEPGTYIFDLGQNFAGVIRLKVEGAEGTRVRIRYGEMLHDDGRLMTENLRKARATDFYTLRGDQGGETWVPRFTYHGFRYVELTGLETKPGLDAVTGLVLHNDTPLVGRFACSDEVMTRFWKNTRWTQRANFIEVPTDCPQRDERLGWMGDAQAYIRTATYNADVAAFFTKWLDDVEEAQLPYGAYPDYCPYPMGHGRPYKNFGTAWTDAGIICPWTIWQVYGDTRVVERHWDSMTRFMEWRAASMAPDGLGASIGNPWGDWLNMNDPTPVEYVDVCYHALDCRLMAEMAAVLGRSLEAQQYRARLRRIRDAFHKEYVAGDGTLKESSQTAHVLALQAGLVTGEQAMAVAQQLARKIAANDHRMSTGFLGTRPLLPVLSSHNQHDLAVRLFQSRRFPSWGYEVVNGATTVWERWDSYTKEHGFEGQSGSQNASMNSFSHYAFGAVAEWMFGTLAGIQSDGPGFKRILIQPKPPTPGSNPENDEIDWVQAEYNSIHGLIRGEWRREGGALQVKVSIPANTTARLVIPAEESVTITENGQPLPLVEGVLMGQGGSGGVPLELQSGSYNFRVVPAGQ